MIELLKATLKTLSLIGILLYTFSLNAQSNLWQSIQDKNIPQKGERAIIPTQYSSFQLDLSQLENLLNEAPLRFSDQYKQNAVILPIPINERYIADFKIVEAPIMAPDLAAKYPKIKTYTGYQIDNPQVKVRLDYTLQGFHAMIYHPQGSIYIDPYSLNDTEHYMLYKKEDYTLESDWQCMAAVEEHISEKNSPSDKSLAGDCELLSYEIAIAATGEYTQYHGGTSQALSAINTILNRVTGIYERDFGITFELIADNDEIIFSNPNTDPYNNNDLVGMMQENQSTIQSIIGSSNYDIGHVFTTGEGGIANFGSVCSNANKARGVTGLPNPIGDVFAVDFVAHEIGHQFGANHTFNTSAGSCGGGNRNNATAMEPGSGSTIMGYAGLCNPDNVQPNSDDYFHAISLEEVADFLAGPGDNCADIISTNNTSPNANAGLNYSIPHSTPFTLVGTASDADGDPLTYCWEQMDNDISPQPPIAGSDEGPNFRSLDPTTSPERTIPSVGYIATNLSNTWEVLTNQGRTFNFRFTVRDNNEAFGCTDEDDMIVTTHSSIGPFLVTSPNTNELWQVGSTQTITWDVANTTNSPVNCDEVDILMSLDGGFTFPITLAEGTTNDGSKTITVPDEIDNQVRIKVACSNNIFFDISNVNLRIEENDCGDCDDGDPCTLDLCEDGVCVSNPLYNPSLSIDGLPNSILECDDDIQLEGTGPGNMGIIVVEVVGDNYGHTDIGIEVYNVTNELVGFTGPQNPGLENGTEIFSYDVQINEGPFRVVMIDAYGDGLQSSSCFNQGQDGSYEIRDGQGNILVAAQPFEAQDANNDGNACGSSPDGADGPIEEENPNLMPEPEIGITGNFSGAGISNGSSNDGIATFDPADAGAGTYDISYTVEYNDCIVELTEEIVVESCSTTGESSFSLRVFLEGAYIGDGTMKTNLQEADLLPNDQPYDAAPYNYDGNESVSNFSNETVDWVLVEIRTGLDNTTTVAKKAALLMSNGQVKDLDGDSDLTFSLDTDESYYVIIRHRNHLDVMSADPVDFDTEMSYNFTPSESRALNDKQAGLDDGFAAMLAGDNTQDFVIQVTDYDLWETNPAQINVYDVSDFTLDGVVQITDFDAWIKNKAILGPSQLAY